MGLIYDDRRAPFSQRPIDEPHLIDVQRPGVTRFVRTLVSQRTIPQYKIGGRVMFRRSDVDQYIDQSKREPTDIVAWQLQELRGSSPRTVR